MSSQYLTLVRRALLSSLALVLLLMHVTAWGQAVRPGGPPAPTGPRAPGGPPAPSGPSRPAAVQPAATPATSPPVAGAVPPATSGFRQEGKVQLVLDPQGYRSRVSDLDFSPDGRLLAVAGEKEVRLYDVEARQLIKTLRGDRSETSYGNINAIQFTPDGRELIVGIDDFSDAGSLRVYDLQNLDEIKQLVPGMNVAVRRLAMTRDGRYLVAAGENGNLYVYDWPARGIVRTIPPAQADQPIFDGLAVPTQDPVVLALTLNGPQLYSIPDGRSLTPNDRLPDALRQWMATLFGRLQLPFGAQLTPGLIWDVSLDRGHWLVGGTSQPEGRPEYWIGFYQAGGNAPAKVYNEHRWTVSAIAASPQGDLVASGDLFGEVHLWNRRTGQTVHRFKSLAQRFYEASFERGGNRIAYGTTNYRGSEYRRNHFGPAEFVFDLIQRTVGETRFAQQLELQFERTQIGNYKVELKQVGSEIHLVSSVQDRPHSRYRLPSGTNPMCYTLLERHRFSIRNPVLYGDDRGVVACWDSDTDKLHRVFIGHGSMVTSLGVSTDGRLLVTSSTDGEICVFSLEGRQPTGHPDFQRQSDVVIDLKPESASARAGVKLGDRIISIDGKSLTELEALLMLGQYPYRPGQVVPAVMERQGKRYTYNMTLDEGPDFVEPLLHLFITPEREWIVWTREGYYDCSPNADRLIGWQVNRGPARSAEFHAVQQFRKQLYRPDVIDKVVQLGDVPAAIAQANAELGRRTAELDLRNREDFDRLRPPVVHWLTPSADAVLDAAEVQVQVRLSSPNALPVRDVTFLIDGAPAHVAHPHAGADGQSIDVTANLALLPGKHRLGVIASNGEATSPVIERTVAYRGGLSSGTEPSETKPKVYVLAVGISKYAHSGDSFRDLKFAAADAREFVAALERHRGGRLYGEVEARLLTDAQATRAAILDGFDWLVRSVQPGDLAMIFISAHGFRDDKQNFYLATHDVELDKLRATAVSWREITGALHEEFPACKRVLFLDTCHSGGVSGRQPIFDPVQDLTTPEVGVIVFSSCQPREESFERSDVRHGAFTYALLETLRDKQSDTHPLPGGNERFSQSELKLGVVDRVQNMTRGRQNPVLTSPPTLREFDLLELLNR